MQRDEFLNELEMAGIDVEGCRNRFMENMELYRKFLYKFLDDKNYPMLLKEVDEKNCEEAFKYAHTLKGVVGNLGIMNIYQVVAQITDCLRNKDIDGANAFIDSLKLEYNKIIQILKHYQK